MTTAERHAEIERLCALNREYVARLAADLSHAGLRPCQEGHALVWHEGERCPACPRPF